VSVLWTLVLRNSKWIQDGHAHQKLPTVTVMHCLKNLH
jgi:hypothetical protein